MAKPEGQRRIPVAFDDSPTLDSFGRTRTSTPFTQFDSVQQYDKGRLYWEEVLTGSASSTHIAGESSIELTVTANAADSAVRQSREYFVYQPGKSLLQTQTAVFGKAVAGVTKSHGLYDGDNGFRFERTATGVYQMVKRSKVTGSVVDTPIAQSLWNLDRLDGDSDKENPSGVLLDGTKGQIFVVDLQWLGIGRVRVGLEIGGKLFYVHEFLHANIDDAAYMTTANLPCRFEIRTDGTNGDSFKTICTTIISEGGFEAGRGKGFSVSNGSALVTVTDARRPILSIRPKDTFNSIVNRGLIVPEAFKTYTQSKEAVFELVYGGTLTGATFTSINDDSIVEGDVAATAISGGIVLDTFITDKKGDAAIPASDRYPMFLNIAGAHPTAPYTDSLSIVATSLVVDTNTNCSASLMWNESR